MDTFVSRMFTREDGRIRGGWKALGFAFLQGLLADAFRLLHPAGAAEPPPWAPHEWFSGAIVLLASWLCLKAEDEDFPSLGLRLDRRWAFEAGVGLVLGLFLILGAAFVGRAFGAFHWVRTPGVGSGGLLLGAWTYAAVAFNEELLFRGYAFFRLKEGVGALPAILVTALLFTAVHWNNPGMAGPTRVWACLNIGLAGLLLGLCAWRTGSLALPMGVHLGWNWAQGSLLGFGVSGTEAKGLFTPVPDGGPAWLSGGDFGLEASLPCALLCGAACLALGAWPRRPAATPASDASSGDPA